jgi:GDP/UDP-N,N'-diacetylbacillosamine 2-epimerase (hydrolysing)
MAPTKMKRKICVVTGSRAEYGLLYWTMKEIQNDTGLDLQILATCMHLSPEFGLTFQEIERDGFQIKKKVEMLLSSDTSVGIAKSMGLGLIGFAEAFEELSPDVILLVGDRFEIFSAAAAATACRVPVAHVHGGETTLGAMDEAFRHSITKMSHLHFVSTEVYRNRVIQLGESPDKVFNVGALGIENIRRMNLLSRDDLEREIGFSLGEKCILVTYHPVTLEHRTAQTQFQNLLDAISTFENLQIIFTKANADTDGRVINQMIDDFVARNSERCIAFTSMGQLKYLSTMKHVDALVGNSSSGIIEAPSFRVPTVNIGDREKGRMKAESVIDCEPVKETIEKGVQDAVSQEFKKKMESVRNPYEQENTSKIIKETIRRFDLNGLIVKQFYDLRLDALKSRQLGDGNP